jgi:hypothetical protein
MYRWCEAVGELLATRRALAGTVSEALRIFLQQRLTSVDQIEIVLLLMRDPARAWTAPEVAQTLGTPPESAAMRLFLLASGGLLSFEAVGIPRYRYVGGDSETSARLAELAAVYATDRAAVVAVVSGPADPLRSFADAFKLKK